MGLARYRYRRIAIASSDRKSSSVQPPPTMAATASPTSLRATSASVASSPHATPIPRCQRQDALLRHRPASFRDLVKEMVLSPYFRANALKGDPSEIRSVELESLGSARFVTPEMLHSKIQAVTGFPWRAGPFGADYLLNSNQYRIFFGGIDSDNVTKRITDPNGFMVSVADRMANDLACTSVARDFAMKKRAFLNTENRQLQASDSKGKSTFH